MQREEQKRQKLHDEVGQFVLKMIGPNLMKDTRLIFEDRPEYIGWLLNEELVRKKSKSISSNEAYLIWYEANKHHQLACHVYIPDTWLGRMMFIEDLDGIRSMILEDGRIVLLFWTLTSKW